MDDHLELGQILVEIKAAEHNVNVLQPAALNIDVRDRLIFVLPSAPAAPVFRALDDISAALAAAGLAEETKGLSR